MELITAINNASKFIEKKNTLPICSNVRIESGILTATDCDTWYVASVNTNGLSSCFDIAPITKGKFKTIEIKQGDNSVLVKDATRSMQLPTKDLAEYPNLPVEKEVIKEFSINAATLYNSFKKVAFAASTDTTRFNICTVNWNSESLVATDGHRLAIDDGSPFPLENASLLLPIGGVKKLLPVLKLNSEYNVLVSYWNDRNHTYRKYITFSFKSEAVTLILTDGQYPDYRQVIPSKSQFDFRVDQAKLLQAIDSIKGVCSDRSKLLKLRLIGDDKGEYILELVASSAEHGEAKAILDANASGLIENGITFGLPAIYLIDAIKALKQPKAVMEFELTDNVSPIRLQLVGEDNYYQIIMPRRTC